jgi:hypothetical protein
MIGAAVLLAGVAACNRGGDNASDDARLNKAAGMLDDNIVVDTSADDASVNAGDVDTGEANAAAPGNSTGNSQ